MRIYYNDHLFLNQFIVSQKVIRLCVTIFFLECWGDASAVGSASGAGSENITFIQDDTQNSSYLVHVWSTSGPRLAPVWSRSSPGLSLLALKMSIVWNKNICSKNRAFCEN